MRKLTVILMMLPSLALAQVTVFDPFLKARPVLTGGTATLLQGAPGAYVTVGSPVLLTGTSVLVSTTATFTTTVDLTVTALRLNISASGLPWNGTLTTDLPLTTVPVPAGSKVVFTFSDPLTAAFATVLTNIDGLQKATTFATFIDASTALTKSALVLPSLTSSKATITPTVTMGAVIVPPPVVVAPSPSPSGSCAGQVIGDCTAALNLPQLVSADGAIWKVAGDVVTRNGVNTNSPFAASGQTQYIYVSFLIPPTIRLQTRDHGFNCWNGSLWIGTGC